MGLRESGTKLLRSLKLNFSHAQAHLVLLTDVIAPILQMGILRLRTVRGLPKVEVCCGSLEQLLLSTCCVPDNMQGAGDTVVRKPITLVLTKLSSQWGDEPLGKYS